MGDAVTDQGSERSAFGAYLDDMARWPHPPEGVPLTTPETQFPGWRGVVLKFLRGPSLLAARTTLSRGLMAVKRPRLEPEGGQLKLHLGSGERAIEGWRNIDLAGSKADFIWDLRVPLPARPGTATAVFNEHFLEHLPLPAAMGILRQSYELLCSGGIIRIGVPDFARYFEDYIEPAGVLDKARPLRPTPMVALNELVYSYGHCSLWDAETLAKLLTEIGFVDAHECELFESKLDPVPDSAFRSKFGPTLYIEAIKP